MRNELGEWAESDCARRFVSDAALSNLRADNLFNLVWCPSPTLQTQRMNIRSHQVSQRVVDQSMLLQASQTLKVPGVDAHAEVAPTVFGASVPGMEMTFVDDLEFNGIERRSQPLAHSLNALRRHGRI